MTNWYVDEFRPLATCWVNPNLPILKVKPEVKVNHKKKSTAGNNCQIAVTSSYNIEGTHLLVLPNQHNSYFVPFHFYIYRLEHVITTMMTDL